MLVKLRRVLVAAQYRADQAAERRRNTSDHRIDIISNMCSSQPWQPDPPPAIARFAAPAEPLHVQPVWVLLEQVCVHDPAMARTVVDGLDMTGRAKGFLLGWWRSSRGDWLGVVNYEVRYADGREATVWWREQLVPAHALRPRTAGRDHRQ
jgi:hypothetical protein